MQPQINKIIADFNKMVELVSIGKTISQFFHILRTNNLSRLELMIIDSSIKGMSMTNLSKTLLLSDENYINILKELTAKLLDIHCCAV